MIASVDHPFGSSLDTIVGAASMCETNIKIERKTKLTVLLMFLLLGCYKSEQ